ncbi:MAG TPA: tripartite tricarboxylate transporter substrate-binding protein, partial [Burkholderiales bacterium]|nr:tripartite tricarboxylate transporter substrate-binding protein [Burkholderiales bacterium]
MSLTSPASRATPLLLAVSRPTRLLLVTAGVLTIGSLATAQPLPRSAAQRYPAKLIRIIVPFAPSGGTDILARSLGQRMSESMGQTVIVENRPGANSIIGTDFVAKAAPDGYTLLFTTQVLTINPALHPSMPYDAQRDFAPVTIAAAAPNLLAVHPSIPVRSVKELIALARAQPGKLNYGSGGPGNSTHLNVEYFKSLAGVDLTHVAYKGSGPAVTDLLGGQIHLMFANIVAVLPQVKSGKLRALATTGPARALSTPDIPTVIEAGVPG